jgi:integrase
MKLSDKIMASLPAPATGNKLTYDSEVKGFAARVTAASVRGFVLNYRCQGRERRITIGQFPAWGTVAARNEAKRLRRLVDQGIDPLAEREAERHADTEGLFEAFAEEFLKHGRKKRGLPLRPATKKEYRRALLTYATPLHGKRLAEIRRGEIASLIRDVATERGEVTAMRTRAALSRLYTWAIANGHAEVNPISGTEGYATPKRSRKLSDLELRTIWAVTAESDDFNLIVRLALWTGTRRGEPGGMADSELEGSEWTVPGARTKNGRALVLPLSRQAVDALAAWPRAEGRDVLFGQGRSGFQGWSKAKNQLDERMLKHMRKLAQEQGQDPEKVKLVPWTLHDCRRVVETRMAGLGIPKEIANRVLNHAVGPITEAYDLYDYLPEKRAALQKWANELDRIVAPPAASNVVALAARR